MTAEFANKTAEDLRQEAARADKDASDSFARSDTDGFLSQWASNITARLKRRQADIVDAGGVATFPGLFDAATGERIRAKLITTQYGDAFAIVGDGGRFTGTFVNFRYRWLNGGAERRPYVVGELVAPPARSKAAKLGLAFGVEEAPAVAYLAGSGTGLSGAASASVAVKRTDGGFPDDAVAWTG